MAAVAVTPVDALDGLTPPLRSVATDAEAYVAIVEPWMDAQQPFAAQMTAIGQITHQNAVIAETAAAAITGAAETGATSTTSLTIGQNTHKSLTFAEAGKVFRLGQTVNVAYTADPTQRMTGVITAVDNTAKTMTVFVPTGGAEGAGTYASWVVSMGGKTGATGADMSGLVPVNAQAGAYTIGASDKGKLVEYTGAGGHTWGVTTVATLGADFSFMVRHAGSGVLTIDPAGAEQIEGRASILVYPGESFRVVGNGTNWRCVGRAKRVLALTAATASQASVAFEAPFADPEAVSLDFDLVGLVGPATSTTLAARLKYGGSYVIAASYRSELGYGAGSTTHDAMFLTGNTSTFAVGGSLRLTNFTSGAQFGPVLAGVVAASGAVTAPIGSLQVAQVGACQGIQFFPYSTTFAAGSGAIRCYINRE